MKNVDQVPDFVLSSEQKNYVKLIYDQNERSIFPDKTVRKLLEIIDDLSSRLIN